MVPSLKTLIAAFPNEDREVLQVIRFELQHADNAPLMLGGRLRRVERALETCNKLLGAHGVELIAEGGFTSPQRTCGEDILCEYVNMGDTYVTTIMYDHTTATFKVQSWGDYVERNWKLCGGE